MPFNSIKEINRSCDNNGIRTHNHLVGKQTLNHLAKLTIWLSYVVSTYLYVAFDCMLLSCHVHVSKWIYELSGRGFESRCCHLNFKYRACFEQGVPWHLGNQRTVCSILFIFDKGPAKLKILDLLDELM